MSVGRVPIEVVVGRGAPARRTRIESMVRARPQDRHWAVLYSSAAYLDVVGDPGLTVRSSGAGCACCIGQVAFRVALTRLLRDLKPDRVLIELPADEHLQRTLALLRDEWFVAVIAVEAIIDADLAPTPI